MIPLPLWMRRALYATAAMNLLAAGAFLPPSSALRALAGLPEGCHPLYLTTVAMFVFLFGLAYLGMAARGSADPLLIAIAAAGKLTFFGSLVWFWTRGDLPAVAPLTGAGDLFFGLLFAGWLLSARTEPALDDRLLSRSSR